MSLTQEEIDLFQLTLEDIDDAHSQLDQEEIYKQEISKLYLKRDESTGKLIKPWRFEVVHGFFKQSDPNTNDLKFNYLDSDFGLHPNDWETLKSNFNELLKSVEKNDKIDYKILFLSRHGQGYHNLCVEKYGLDLWNEKYCKLTNDDEITWAPDPKLTEKGEAQAIINNKAWKEQISKGCPIPTAFFVSPLNRSSTTLVKTWNEIIINNNSSPQGSIPITVVEKVRETLGIHLCNERSTKTVINNNFAKFNFKFEENFAENDELFNVIYKDVKETLAQHCLRTEDFLQELFESDQKSNSIVNITSHAGTIRAFITALNHRRFGISTGGMIPIVVKATRIE
ncbi:hypothetical protein BVG19_g2406 [[Candida] boidinii]|nr:hypothetical protein BVG19_g2406 [[Candida] boidinii]OWB53372.1 hypothetical protein B5S27_g4968 [[Candida] boidinii]OWB83970.1 hypothetical protein B5S33_g2606 [[Candida] boidinii]